MPPTKSLAELLVDVRACTVCAPFLPLGPRPVLQAGASARLCIVGQAPGLKVHETGIPWNDLSGVRLRAWLDLAPAQFYDAARVAIVPIGFCYPGRGASGDNPPRPECAPLWHAPLNERMPQIALTLLIGGYAQAYYLRGRRKASMGLTIKAWREYLPLGFLPLPHPSPRNQPWLVKNPWFEAELVPELRRAIVALRL